MRRHCDLQNRRLQFYLSFKIHQLFEHRGCTFFKKIVESWPETIILNFIVEINN